MHIGLAAKSDVASALDLASDLAAAGARVTLYLSDEGVAREVDAPDRPVERLYELGLLPRSCDVRLFHLPRMRDPRGLRAVRALAQTISGDGIDVVHILSGPHELWLALLACAIRDVPVVSTMIVPRQNVGEYPAPPVARAINATLARGSDIVVVNGASQVDEVCRRYGLPRGRIAHIRLGARTTAVRWAGGGRTEEPGTVLLFGRMSWHKGLRYLVAAQPIVTRQVPDARFIIAGHGSELAACRPQIQDPGRFEIFEGYMSGDTAAGFFERASIVGLPYLSASTSGVLLTAYSFGKPVVASRVGCLPEYVRHGGTGLLVEPADVGQLADALVHLLRQDTLRRQMGIIAQHWVERERETIVEQSLAVYERAWARRCGPPRRARGSEVLPCSG